ncbi:MAG: molecular chaperone HtpG [Lachnospiraceae bacterium]|nr:molecular chaperone HtpG [Lachnospiraceae bacterium]
METKKGNLSINSDNIFPIIKKWLYSDHDIFIRELISNGCDAITKLKKLSMIGEAEIADGEDFRVTVIVNPTEKTIKFVDNGIGMSAEEINKYINEIAFSGAVDFMEKYKDKASDDQIIGHFGLGFYSAFMVADRVTIESKTFKDEPAVGWESEQGLTYEMGESEKTTRGTEITLYLNDDSTEFCNEYRVREVIEKYCSFMPIDIYLEDETAGPRTHEISIPESEVMEGDEIIEHLKDEKTSANKEGDEGDADAEPEVVVPRVRVKRPEVPKPLNDTTPLYAKHPNECTDEEYKEFYRKVFNDYKEPLFWIHLNMDYPFNLKGILYFPKINMEYETIEGKIKLYNNRVFVADNIKEVIPEYLLLLKGTIDCPDLPLNVSRSALQNDGFVKKISDYISKKVADKLSGMCKTDRENYEKYWDDIAPFIKFGCIKDEKFAEKMTDYILYKNLDGKYLLLNDALEENKEKNQNKIFYVTDEVAQGQYIKMFKDAGTDAMLMNTNIDTPFISFMENKNKDVKFVRIDSDLEDSFKDTPDDEDFKKSAESLTEIFKKALGNDKLDVKVEKLKNDKIAAMMTMSEEGRRMQEMMKMYQMYGMNDNMFGDLPLTLVVNANHPLISYIQANPEGENTKTVCEQVYDLAELSHGSLPADRMTRFIERSNEIMLLLNR